MGQYIHKESVLEANSVILRVPQLIEDARKSTRITTLTTDISFFLHNIDENNRVQLIEDCRYETPQYTFQFLSLEKNPWIVNRDEKFWYATHDIMFRVHDNSRVEIMYAHISLGEGNSVDFSELTEDDVNSLKVFLESQLELFV